MTIKTADEKRRLSRREVLKLGVATSAAGFLGVPRDAFAAKQGAAQIAPIGGPGYVVRVHKPGMRGRFFPHTSAAKEMVGDKAGRSCKVDNRGTMLHTFVSWEAAKHDTIARINVPLCAVLLCVQFVI
jgi:hypothetical protein